jgi:hypothetical protein
MATTQIQNPLQEHEVHDVLRNQRRMHTLNHLKEAEGTVTLRELSEAIATVETGESPPPRNIRESVYNALHQTHLPKLDTMGVVAYERNRKLIELSDAAEQVDLYMEVVPDQDITWSAYYRTVGIIALVVVTLSGVGLPMFAAVSAAFWAVGFLGLFAVSLLYQYFEHASFRG